MNDTEKDTLLRRLIYRANHRGIKEMDIILGRFADEELSKLNAAQIKDFEALMCEHDRDLLMWFTGETEFPFEGLREIFDRVRSHVLERHHHD